MRTFDPDHQIKKLTTLRNAKRDDDGNLLVQSVDTCAGFVELFDPKEGLADGMHYMCIRCETLMKRSTMERHCRVNDSTSYCKVLKEENSLFADSDDSIEDRKKGHKKKKRVIQSDSDSNSEASSNESPSDTELTKKAATKPKPRKSVGPRTKVPVEVQKKTRVAKQTRKSANSKSKSASNQKKSASQTNKPTKSASKKRCLLSGDETGDANVSEQKVTDRRSTRRKALSAKAKENMEDTQTTAV